MPGYLDPTFASNQHAGRSAECACGERHVNQRIPTPHTPPQNPLATQPAGPDSSGSSSSHNSHPPSVQGVDVQSDPNARTQELACDSADSQPQQSQLSTTDQILTESGVTSNGDNQNPTIQIRPGGNADEPQPAPGTPTGATADPAPPYPELHGGHAPRPRGRRQGNVRSDQAGLSQSTYFSSHDRYEYRSARHPDERPLVGVHKWIGSTGRQPGY